MTHEQAWQLVRKAFDGISGFTPPQVRQMDLAFQAWAQLVMQETERTAAEPKPKSDKAGKS